MIKISPSFFLMLMMTVILQDTGYMLALLSACLFHEAGHLLGFKLFNVPIRKIELKFYSIGITPKRPLGNKEEIIIAALGPLFSFVLFGTAELISLEFSAPHYLMKCAVTSFTMGIFNSLPVLPLDGGRILQGVTDAEKARKISEFSGLAVMTAGMILLIRGENASLFIMGAMLFVSNLPVKGKGNKKCLRKKSKSFCTGCKSPAGISAENRIRR